MQVSQFCSWGVSDCSQKNEMTVIPIYYRSQETKLANPYNEHQIHLHEKKERLTWLATHNCSSQAQSQKQYIR